MTLFTLDNLFLLLTGLVAIYLLWRFYTRWSKEKKVYDLYYGMGFLVLLVSGLAFISLGSQLLFFSPAFVMLILTPLLLLMTLAFTFGFVKDIKG